MDKFILMIQSIDWVFAGVILVGGRYFGSKYFRLSKRDAINFLGFATAFGVIWLMIKYFTDGIGKNEVGNLFITYLFTTSFYEVMAKKLFEMVENALPWFKEKQKPDTTISIKDGVVTDITETKKEQ